MIGVGGEERKTNKSLIGAILAPVINRIKRWKRGTATNRMLFDSPPPSRLARITPWLLLLLALCALVSCHGDASASNAALHHLQSVYSDQSIELDRSRSLFDSSRLALAESEAARDQIKQEFQSIRTKLDTAVEEGQQVTKRLEQMQHHVGSIEKSSTAAHASLRDRLSEVRDLALAKTQLLASLQACHIQLNSTIAIRSDAVTTIMQTLRALGVQVDLQDSILTQMRNHVEAMRIQSGEKKPYQSPVMEEQWKESKKTVAQLLQTASSATEILQHDSGDVRSGRSLPAAPIAADSAQLDPAIQHALPVPSSTPIAAAHSGVDVRELHSKPAPQPTSTEEHTDNRAPDVTTPAPAPTAASAVVTNPPATSAPVGVSIAKQPVTPIDQIHAEKKRHNPLAPQSRDGPKRHPMPRRKKPHSTPQVDEDPAHPYDQIHFVKTKPLHQQPEHIRPPPHKDQSSVAEFPRKYAPNGAMSQLSKAQSADVYAKQQSIRSEFWHAWSGYRQHAYGFDELHPISRTGRNSQYYMSLTMIDALDTMVLMGFDEEYAHIRTYLAEYLLFTEQEDINVFETTIRVIGGLLSVFALTGDHMFLSKAAACADGLLVAFETPTGLPYGTVGLRSKQASNPAWAQGSSTMSEIGSIQLEWEYLSRATGNDIYLKKVDKIIDHLYKMNKTLYPQFINVESGVFSSSVFTFGARVDSIYEYFLKSHLLTPGRNSQPIDLYTRAMQALDAHLVKEARPIQPGTDPLTYIAELHGTMLQGKMDHLVCFVPGMLALGAFTQSVNATVALRHMDLAKKLMRTCYEMYSFTSTGLSPEIVQFSLNLNSPDPGMKVDPHAQHNMLRPETVESLFIMWRVTKEPIYREWGWNIFTAMREYCKVDGAGYSGIKDVRVKDRPQPHPNEPNPVWANWNDKMESFFLSETLKYLYLLFSPDDLLPLSDWVFNTEAHPLPVWKEDGTDAAVVQPKKKQTNTSEAGKQPTTATPTPGVLDRVQHIGRVLLEHALAAAAPDSSPGIASAQDHSPNAHSDPNAPSTVLAAGLAPVDPPSAPAVPPPLSDADPTPASQPDQVTQQFPDIPDEILDQVEQLMRNVKSR